MAEHHLDLVVLEINLPHMDGMERMLAGRPGLPIIINSGYSTGQAHFCPWASAFVAKSSNLDELKLRIQQVLAAHEPKGNA